MKLPRQKRQIPCRFCGRVETGCGLPETLTQDVAQRTHQLQIALDALLEGFHKGRISNGGSQKESNELRAVRLAITRYSAFLSGLSDQLRSASESATKHEPGVEVPEEGRRLSPREQEVVRLIAQGSSSKEVASKLSINVRTVETHRARIMLKLNLKSLASLVRYAVRMNLI